MPKSRATRKFIKAIKPRTKPIVRVMAELQSFNPEELTEEDRTKVIDTVSQILAQIKRNDELDEDMNLDNADREQFLRLKERVVLSLLEGFRPPRAQPAPHFVPSAFNAPPRQQQQQQSSVDHVVNELDDLLSKLTF